MSWWRPRRRSRRVNDGLFDRGVGSKGERFVGVSLRIKSGNLDVIDRLAHKHGAVKRSPFVAAVLTAYLILNATETDERGECWWGHESSRLLRDFTCASTAGPAVLGVRVDEHVGRATP